MRQQKTGIFLKLKSVDSVEMSHLMDILTVSACVHVCAGVCTLLATLPLSYIPSLNMINILNKGRV